MPGAPQAFGRPAPRAALPGHGRARPAAALRQLVEPRAALAAACVAVLAVVLRLPPVWGQSFWEDEVASARIVSEPTLLGMLRHVERTESTPPFWYLLAWLAHHAGAPLPAERLLSVACGGLTSVVVVVLGLRFMSLAAATLAGVMCALGGELVRHGYELRSYELLLLLAALFGLLLAAEHGEPRRRTELQLGAVVAMGGLTHYFFAFTVISALAWLWLDRGAAAVRRRATRAILVGAVLPLAWLPVMLAQYRAGRLWWIGSFRARAVLAVPLRLFSYAYIQWPAGPMLSALTLGVVVLGALRLARRTPVGRMLLVLALLPIAAAAGAWRAGMRIFDLRNLIEVAPFVALLVAAALDALPRRLAPLAAAAAASLLAWSTLANPPARVLPYDAIAGALVRAGWSEAIPIVVSGDPYRARAPLEWYLPRRPALGFARLGPTGCPHVYLLTRNGRIRDLKGRPALLTHAATVLVHPGAEPACVELLPT